MTTVADLQGKVAVEGIEQAISGLQKFHDAFTQAGTGASKAKKPVDDIFAALGTGVDTVRTAFQYRRDGHVGLLAEHDEAITVSTTEACMRISIPLVGEDHTPTFQLL